MYIYTILKVYSRIFHYKDNMVSRPSFLYKVHLKYIHTETRPSEIGFIVIFYKYRWNKMWLSNKMHYTLGQTPFGLLLKAMSINQHRALNTTVPGQGSCGMCVPGITGDPLHSRTLAHSRAPLFTQPCTHCSQSRAPGEQWARLCVFTLQGCVQAARLCRGSPVGIKAMASQSACWVRDFGKALLQNLASYTWN